MNVFAAACWFTSTAPGALPLPSIASLDDQSSSSGITRFDVLSVQHIPVHMALALRHDESVTWRGRHSGTLVIQNGREPVFGGVAYVGVYESRLLAAGSPEDLPPCGSVWVRGYPMGGGVNTYHRHHQ